MTSKNKKKPLGLGMSIEESANVNTPEGHVTLKALKSFARSWNRLAELVNRQMHAKGFYDNGLPDDAKTAIKAALLGALAGQDFMLTPGLEQDVEAALDGINMPRNEGEVYALIHSEISEALEGVRKPGLMDDKLTQYPAKWVELADAIIRILDWAGEADIPLGDIIAEKIIFNLGREYKHGKEF